MKINPLMKVRDVAGEHIVIRQSGDKADMTTVVALNESALAIYRALEGRDSFEADDVVRLLTDRYDVDEATARADAARLLADLRYQGLATD